MCHLGWLRDALRIEFGVTKSNQEGERRESRLLFANPMNPKICPILCLAVYLSSLGTMLNGTDKLFFGGNQASRFHKALHRCVSSSELTVVMQTHGLTPDEIGAHSIRKGAGTFISNGSTASPSYPSICIRMSWSLGNTKERYLFYNYASDAYCGRILAGLDQTSVFFAVLPPHSLSSIPLEITGAIFPSTKNISTLELVRQFCVCSLLHHTEFLVSVLGANHDLFSTYLFRNHSALKEAIPVISGIMSPVLTPNGLPPHVLSWLNDSKIMDGIDGLPSKILGGMGRILQENGVNAGNITKEMLETMMKNLLEADRSNRTATIPPENPPNRSEYLAYLWKSDGMFHRLPEDYSFPSLTVLQTWLVWWGGNTEKKIPPYQYLMIDDVPVPQRKMFSNIKCMMKEMIKALHPLTADDIRKESTSGLLALFERGSAALPKKRKIKTSRWSEWTISTAIRELREARVLENPERKRKQRPPIRRRRVMATQTNQTSIDIQ